MSGSLAFFTLSKWGRRQLGRLHKDEGGNIFVLYIGAALLLVGMLWAIIGTGQRLVQKETIQSSADAAAFSAAVIASLAGSFCEQAPRATAATSAARRMRLPTAVLRMP